MSDLAVAKNTLPAAGSNGVTIAFAMAVIT